MFIPVIMAGGSGSRLWPLSRSAFPKQFLSLDSTSKSTMLQSTIERIQGISTAEPIIIANENHRHIVSEQIKTLCNSPQIILEKEGRNTAPAIALAAFLANAQGQDPILLVLAADHFIKNDDAFKAAVLSAEIQANEGKLVTFGIIPTEPETGYGYIRLGEKLANACHEVAEFVEKPNRELAEEYLKTENFLWNSGCFMFKASTYLNELKNQKPNIYGHCQDAMKEIAKDGHFLRVCPECFLKCDDLSIDYAVMENAKEVVVISMDAGWSDIGSWSALWDVSDKDEKGNVHCSNAILEDTTNSYIYSPKKIVAAVGLNNLIIVETKDAILVADKNKVQDVKKIVEYLKRENKSEYKDHKEQYRTWGKADAIEEGERYRVNRITVEPGKKQSLQLHYHRAEHWVVVSGTAKVTVDDCVKIITENQSLYIPVGVSHLIENPGKIALELIEIQSGSYLHEDDIVRLEED